MIVMTGIIGRINLQQIFKITIIFQIFWNICFNLLIYLAVVVQPGANIPYTPYIFDQFGSTYTYLFATCFGIVVTSMMYHQRMLSTHPRN
jgi:ATP/ADP translocase